MEKDDKEWVPGKSRVSTYVKCVYYFVNALNTEQFLLFLEKAETKLWKFHKIKTCQEVNLGERIRKSWKNPKGNRGAQILFGLPRRNSNQDPETKDTRSRRNNGSFWRCQVEVKTGKGGQEKSMSSLLSKSGDGV